MCLTEAAAAAAAIPAWLPGGRAGHHYTACRASCPSSSVFYCFNGTGRARRRRETVDVISDQDSIAPALATVFEDEPRPAVRESVGALPPANEVTTKGHLTTFR